MQIIDPEPHATGVTAAFLDLVGPDRAVQVRAAAARLSEWLAGGTLWHVNSTNAGGGVAEMLRVLVPLYRELGVPARWAVVNGEAGFFDITKRLGNLTYGSEAEADQLRPGDLDSYLACLSAEAEQLRALLGPRDALLLHDHQTAGLVPALIGKVAAVHWRCHVGVDEPTAGSAAAWAALAPLLERADSVVFSVPRHIPAELNGHRTAVISPVIWPFSAKNRPLTDNAVRDCLERCGLGTGPATSAYVVADASRDPAAPLVVQVSRWDRLKDMHGVLAAFAEWVPDAHLALVGPDPAGISDDTDQARWFGVSRTAWQALPSRVRARARLVCLPMSNLEDNARLVNAVQRAADVVVQKSLAEGFGLTVTEAMWKARPVVGSAVGGITEQITHCHNGLLLDDPHDQPRFATLVASVTSGAVDGAALGRQAHDDVHRRYLPDSDVLATAGLLTD